MNGEGPSLRSRNLWTKRTSKFLSILERALKLLGAQATLPSAEVDLNRQLYFCLLQASRLLHPSEELAPSQECNNQPDPDDQARAVREAKRPDFQWIYLDRYEPDPCRSSKQFVVECKRLGSAPRADWILNTNYVEHGIWRFAAPKWGYAQRFPSAAMVGYWQDMEAADVLKDVNETVAKRGLTVLKLSRDGWNIRGVSKLEHALDRPFHVSPLLLHHLWADLRGKRPA